MNKIRVVIIRYKEDVRESVLTIEEIDNNLETMNKLVGGYIEMPSLSLAFSRSKISCTINEEGKIKGLRPTAYASFPADIICGTIVFAGFNDSGATVGLTDEQIDIILNKTRQKTELVQKGSSGSLIYVIS